MKYFLCILLLLANATALLAQRSHRMPPRSNGELYIPNVSATIKPGDTILLSGKYKIINLNEVNGTAEKPIVIYAWHPVTVGVGASNYGIMVQGRYWKFLGAGHTTVYNPDYTLNVLFNAGNSRFFSIDSVSLRNGQVGIFALPADSATHGDVRITNCSIAQIKGARTAGKSQAIHIGATNVALADTVGYRSVQIAHCSLSGIDGVGIQVVGTRTTLIEDVRIDSFGRAALPFQNSGIVVGPHVALQLQQSHISTGTGPAVSIFSAGVQRIAQCVFMQTATAADQDAVYIEQKQSKDAVANITLTDVQINGANRYGVHNVLAKPVRLIRVQISKAGKAKTFGPVVLAK
ncbi:right-handed parallel beta-helix repeat-containing protein [Phnomibacter ginsenosidimutans]|uniref:Right handed beta helix domain-containing protein n=1 Tax=Phnomibacter ginsenosidimutans TaxID=2676868 RepID=A0A6I6G4E8_9BACT|nr:right-handed parallel beta-helix repeat-containing protein [Phnomibacter ginsenosidimutans]QGW26784.1 hypothetical protein GLV81_00505 [Phnomibacter ginsenosidimutans]